MKRNSPFDTEEGGEKRTALSSPAASSAPSFSSSAASSLTGARNEDNVTFAEKFRQQTAAQVKARAKANPKDRGELKERDCSELFAVRVKSGWFVPPLPVDQLYALTVWGGS